MTDINIQLIWSCDETLYPAKSLKLGYSNEYIDKDGKVYTYRIKKHERYDRKREGNVRTI